MAQKNLTVLELVRCVYAEKGIDGSESVQTFRLTKLVEANTRRNKANVSRAVQILERHRILTERQSKAKDPRSTTHLVDRKRLEELFVYITLPHSIYVYDNNAAQ